MPALSFKVFKQEILNGVKTQTVRFPRKHPVKKGDRLYLYWHMRLKDCSLLKTVECTEVLEKAWREIKQDPETARRDGFHSTQEMKEWFERQYGSRLTNDTLLHVVRWEPAPHEEAVGY